MTQQESEQLTLFLQQLTEAQANRKDSEADALIRDACGRQPDASYLLVQRAMQLEHVLQATNARCAQLQSDLEQARSGTQNSFLEDPNAWGKQPAAPATSMAPMAIPSRTPAPAPAAPPPSWSSGILGNVATTAAGVVAGSFLFQGIENLIGHHNQSGFSNLADRHAALPVADNNTIYGVEPDATLDIPADDSDFGSGGDSV